MLPSLILEREVAGAAAQSFHVNVISVLRLLGNVRKVKYQQTKTQHSFLTDTNFWKTVYRFRNARVWRRRIFICPLVPLSTQTFNLQVFL